MVDTFLSGQVSQFNEHLPLRSFLHHHMGSHQCFSRLQLPNVKVTDLNHSWDHFKEGLQILDRQMQGRGIHQKMVGVVDDWEGRN